VYKQWQGYAGGFDVSVALVGNKVQTAGDVAFLRSHAGENPVAWIGHEPVGRAMEQGQPFSLDDLSRDTAAALSAVKSRLDAAPRDWPRYTRLAAEFHRRNARSWASGRGGEDLAAQIDPDFTLGPDALVLALRRVGGPLRQQERGVIAQATGLVVEHRSH
jgi:CO dehydrogenase maturation factor